MLKLERTDATQQVEIRINEKRSFFDRHLRQAFTYSLLFHALLFGLFRIKFSQIHETAEAFRPVQVAVDNEKIEENAQQAIAEVADTPINLAPHSTQALLARSWPFNFDQALSSVLLSPSSDAYETEDVIESSEMLLQESAKLDQLKIRFSEHVYPLTLKLSKKLSRLQLIEDGHELFRLKAKTLADAHLLLATTSYPISYKVHILGKTGKVILWDRKKELIDKQLQEYADKIVQTLTFEPFAEDEIKGRIQIIFKCDGQKIQEFLQ